MQRRTFIKHGSLALLATATTTHWTMIPNSSDTYDVIIIGGSYSGLSAALSLGRARRKVLIIDANEPCNARVPHSHNLLTHDGTSPRILKDQAIADVLKYPTIHFHHGSATAISGADGAFNVRTTDGAEFHGLKLLLALGVRDELPVINGLAECWGISAAACPFCHGYEVRDQRIGVIGNAPDTLEYARLIRNWTDHLCVFTNGPAVFTTEERAGFAALGIDIDEHLIDHVAADRGQVSAMVLKGSTPRSIEGIFLRSRTSPPITLLNDLKLELNEQGLIKVDFMQRTNVTGIFASGDCTTPMRALSMAIATGGVAGSVILHDLLQR